MIVCCRWSEWKQLQFITVYRIKPGGKLATYNKQDPNGPQNPFKVFKSVCIWVECVCTVFDVQFNPTESILAESEPTAMCTQTSYRRPPITKFSDSSSQRKIVTVNITNGDECFEVNFS